jgi:hypothetical protein
MSEPTFTIKDSSNDVDIPQGFLTRPSYSVFDKNGKRLMVLAYDDEDEHQYKQIPDYVCSIDGRDVLFHEHTVCDRTHKEDFYDPLKGTIIEGDPLLKFFSQKLCDLITLNTYTNDDFEYSDSCSIEECLNNIYSRDYYILFDY